MTKPRESRTRMIFGWVSFLPELRAAMTGHRRITLSLGRSKCLSGRWTRAQDESGRKWSGGHHLLRGCRIIFLEIEIDVCIS